MATKQKTPTTTVDGMTQAMSMSTALQMRVDADKIRGTSSAADAVADQLEEVANALDVVAAGTGDLSKTLEVIAATAKVIDKNTQPGVIMPARARLQETTATLRKAYTRLQSIA